MGERRKRKSMWHMEDENRQFSHSGDHNSWVGKERHSINNRGRDHEFRGSRDFTEPKPRDRPGRPSHELNEENMYYQNMSPGLDGIERRKYKHCPDDERGGYHRYPRKDRSRSRSRSRSPRGRARSGSPRRDYKNQCHKWSDNRSETDRQFQICRDFSAGRCRKGSQCRFDHSRNTSRGHSSKDSYSKVTGSDLRDEVPNYYQGEEGQFRKKSRNAVPCREFLKGWCKWGDSCRFSHHLSSNETTDTGNPGDNSNSRFGNRSSLCMENEDACWRTRELGDICTAGSIDKENMANNQKGYNMSHGFSPQNEVGNVTAQEQHTLLDNGGVKNGIVTSFGSDVLDEVKSSDPVHPFPFPGQNQSSENVLVPALFSVSNTTDIWPNIPSGGLDVFKTQDGAQMDVHSKVPHHQLETQSGALLDLYSQVKNHQLFEAQSGAHLDMHSQVKNHLPETHSDARLDLHSHVKNYQLETESGVYFDLHSQVKNHVPEMQSGPRLDLHYLAKNDELEKQSGAHLDLHSQVKNHLPETHSDAHLDLHSHVKNYQLETQSGVYFNLHSQVKNHIPETLSGARLDLHSQAKNDDLEKQSGTHLDLHSQVKNHIPETQSGARLDLHSQAKNHELDKQSGAHLDLHSEVKNHIPETQSGARLDLHSQEKNHELEKQSGANLDLHSRVTNHIRETQSGAHFDLHSQAKNHELETQSGAHLDFHSQVKNHLHETQSGTRLDLQSPVPNHQRAVQILTGLLESKVTFPIIGFPSEPINHVEKVTAASKHGNYTEQYNQIPTKPTSPLPTICKGPDILKVDDSENSKQKQEGPLANPEADEGNKAGVEEIKGVENNKKAEENITSKEEKAMRLFKNSLIEFVKDILKPTWKEGRLSREVHKTIVKKVVDKVTGTVQPDHVPKAPDKVDQYLSSSKPKIAKLVQAYVERSQKTDS